MPNKQQSHFQIIYTPEKDQDAVFSKIPPKLCYLGRHAFSGDWTIKRQRSKEYIISYIQDGKAEITVRDKKYMVKKGDILVYRPHETHSGKSIGAHPYKTVIFRIDFSDEILHHARMKEKFGQINQFTEAENWKLRSLLDALLEEYPPLKTRQNPLLVKNYLLEIFQVINEYLELKKQQKPIQLSKHNENYKTEICLKAKDYMEKHYAEPLKLDEIAGHLSLSVSRFSHLFSEYVHLSPIEYLLKLRLEKARQLLLHTDKTITQIATETGFSNANYFIRMFRKFEQTTPARYRRNIAR